MAVECKMLSLESRIMKRIKDTWRFVCVCGGVLFIGYVSAVTSNGGLAETDKPVVKTDESIEDSRRAWNRFLSANCSDDDTEQSIRKLMEGKYREIGVVRTNKETHGLLFLIDDFHQVNFGFFDKTSKLMYTPRVEPKGQWLRMPNGYVKSIPNPVEAKLKSKVAAVALDYVVKRTNRKRDSWSVHCERSDTTGTWTVLVVDNGLEVDPPAYRFEITNDGVVVHSPFKDDATEESKRGS
jgi:hypothetical protein